MLKNWFATSLILLLVGSVQLEGAPTDSYSSIFNLINAYLGAHTESTDAETNFKVASEWYWSLHNEQGDLRHGLQMFQALSKVVEEPHARCNRNITDILSQLHDATEGRAAKNKDGRNLGRVESILKELSTVRAKECQSVYLKQFLDWNRSKANYANQEELVQRANELVSTYIAYWIREKTDNKGQKMFVFFIWKRVLLNMLVNEMPGIAFKGLMKAAALNNDKPSHVYESLIKTTDGKKDIDHDKFQQLFENNLVKPCTHLKGELENVFESANYDLIWSHEVDEQQVDFYRYWTGYLICSGLLEKKEATFEGSFKYAQNVIESYNQ